MLMHRWSPPSEIPVTNLDNYKSDTQRMCLRWCKLVVSTLVLLVFISFVIIYGVQRDSFFMQEYQQKQTDDSNQRQRLLFDAYIRDVSTALLQISDDKYLDISSKTLTLLRFLEVKRKQNIILFLYERNLLQDNRLNLHGADFNNVELVCPHDFRYFYVAGVSWSHAYFINCPLQFANFDNTYLKYASFINSTIQDASFIKANLDYSRFIHTNVRNSNFNYGSLIQAAFFQANIVQGNNFSNADLYQANLTNEQLEGKQISIIGHDFRHARFPNGSFGLIDPAENLILNGNAETECFSNMQTIWTTNNPDNGLFAEKFRNQTNENGTTSESDWGNCSFVMSQKTRVYQNIDLDSYSVLIDTNNAEISFLGFANCIISYFEIHMFRSDDILHDLKIYQTPGKAFERFDNITMYSYEDQYKLLANTRRIQIYFGIEAVEDVGIRCYFDNIALNIYQVKNNTKV